MTYAHYTYIYVYIQPINPAIQNALHPSECRQMASYITTLIPMPSSGLLSHGNVDSLQGYIIADSQLRVLSSDSSYTSGQQKQ